MSALTTPRHPITKGVSPDPSFASGFAPAATSSFIMPVFALANAGVAFDMAVFTNPTSQMVGVAVACGLLIGKPLGIGLFSYFAVKSKIAVMPTGVNWGSLIGVGLLAGIGFTMSLFVTNLAFSDPILIAGSKIGIFAGSVLAAVFGIIALQRSLPSS